MSERIIYLPGEISTEIELFQNGGFGVKREQDLSAILDANKRDRNEGDGYTPSRDMKHVARIPLILIEKWTKEAGLKPHECMGPKMVEIIRRKLNDPDHAFLRTSKGLIK